MLEPSTTSGRNLRREAQALIEQAAVQQAESSAFRMRSIAPKQPGGTARQDHEASVHTPPGGKGNAAVEAYVDDIVVKSRKPDNLVADLRIAFDCLRAKGVKLNPEKCVFGVPRGMLLGFIVSQRGIEPNPEKVSAITRMGPIRDLKGV